MKAKKNTLKFIESNQNKISKLGESNERFKRIFHEYEFLNQELKSVNAKDYAMPDDFVDSLELQTTLLEEEIIYWLSKDV